MGAAKITSSNFRAVATCRGAAISNVTEGSNVEKITVLADRDFSSDTGFWSKGGTADISGGQVNLPAENDQIKTSFLSITSGRWYKLSAEILSSNLVGSLSTQRGTYTFDTNFGNSVGVHTVYAKALNNGTNVAFSGSGGFIGSFDNVSIEEVGWEGSQDLYDVLIAQGSTVLEATTAAAMWCYYNNDADLGAIYSKIYNGFAKNLLSLDIATYNTENAETWGAHVTTEAEWTAIETEVGGDSDKLKEASDRFWLSNTGTNETGLTLLPAGYRDVDGTFKEIGETAVILTADGDEDKRIGGSIRLTLD
jgi:uncharacterized protein (TIGR02145 family)